MAKANVAHERHIRTDDSGPAHLANWYFDRLVQDPSKVELGGIMSDALRFAPEGLESETMQVFGETLQAKLVAAATLQTAISSSARSICLTMPPRYSARRENWPDPTGAIRAGRPAHLSRRSVTWWRRRW